MNYLLIVVLVALSAFFSGSETAYASLNAIRLRRNAEEKGGSSKTALFIYEHYERALSSILIGNNLVNIAASSVATVIAISIAGPAGTAYAAVIMTVIILIFGEIIPKIFAKDHADSAAPAAAYPLRFFMIVTFPLVFIVQKFVSLVSKLWGGTKEDETITEDELSNIIELVEDEGVIDEDQSELLQSAIDFPDITAQEILTPRVDLTAIDVEDSMDEILETADSSPYSRIPVYEETIDNIIGILYLNHFYKKIVETRDFSIRDILIEPCFIHKSLKLPAVLSELRRCKTHIAVVTDEYGGTSGIVTMEDVLEQLVGDIWDETDVVTDEIKEIEENTYEVDGDMSIYDFLEEVGRDPDSFEGDFTTVGGFVTEMKGGFPEPGDSFTYENMTLTVLETDDMRVKKLKVVVSPEKEQED